MYMWLALLIDFSNLVKKLCYRILSCFASYFLCNILIENYLFAHIVCIDRFSLSNA